MANEIDRFEVENVALRAEVDRLHAELRRLEWSAGPLPHGLSSHYFCPGCGRPVTVGHRPDCTLAAALGVSS